MIESQDNKLIFDNDFFSYENEPCTCGIDTINVEPGVVTYTLKIQSRKDEKVYFAFGGTTGLCRTTVTGSIKEENLLSMLSSIPDNRIDEVLHFFEDNGFLLKVSSESFEAIDMQDKQLREYEPEVREWAVGIYNEYGKQMNRYIGNIMKENELFFLYDTDSEFRNASYDCYSRLIKKFSFLKDQTEMLFLFIKDYHRVESEQRFGFGVPSISEEITDWVDKTWAKHQVNLLAFAYDWINSFYENEDIWPSTHRKKSQYSWRKYDYDYKQKSNLFNLDSLYRKMPKKSFIKGRKQEIEILFMYYWIHDMEGDNDYWQEYLEIVLPGLKKTL